MEIGRKKKKNNTEKLLKIQKYYRRKENIKLRQNIKRKSWGIIKQTMKRLDG